MDMSVKLTQSYQAVKPMPVTLEKTAEVPQVAPVVKADVVSDSSESKKEARVTEAQQTEKLKAAVKEIDNFVKSVQRNLEFSIDEGSGEIVVKVIASDTGEIVRQLPSAEAIKIAESLHNAHSLLFDAKV